MIDSYDDLEGRSVEARELDLLTRLPEIITYAQDNAPAWRERLAGVDAGEVTSRAALASLPVTRKYELLGIQKDSPPFGGFAAHRPDHFPRVFMSPGPLFEPQGEGADPWKGARILYAAGFRRGELVHNSFAYHMTPGGFILDSAARALGCSVFPAGVGNTEMQVDAIAALKPDGYAGTPDFLKILLDKADELGKDASSITKALVSGAALPASLRTEMRDRGVSVLQGYAIAEAGFIAYESAAMEGMIVNEDMIVEIVRPGTGDPVAEGEVGEVVVTTFNTTYPMIRLGTGDLSAVLAGTSPCGRTNMRIKGWMGRADQRTKVKGMFIDPVQVNEIAARHRGLGKLRLVVSRNKEQDVMVLMAEVESPDENLKARLGESLQAVCKMRGAVELVAPGSLPNDGKVIADERPVG